jgi:hypothetical protein
MPLTPVPFGVRPDVGLMVCPSYRRARVDAGVLPGRPTPAGRSTSPRGRTCQLPGPSRRRSLRQRRVASRPGGWVGPRGDVRTINGAHGGARKISARTEVLWGTIISPSTTCRPTAESASSSAVECRRCGDISTRPALMLIGSMKNGPIPALRASKLAAAQGRSASPVGR